MLTQGRTYSAANSYRYGFNGKENDNEVKGEGDQQDYGMRIYDPRLGRFLSVDPLRHDYPELTPYQFASNTPIQAVDLDGGEAVTVTAGGRATFIFFSVAVNATIAFGPKSVSVYITPEAGLGGGASIAAGVSIGYYPKVTDSKQFGGWGINLGGSIAGNGGDFSVAIQSDATPKAGASGAVPKLGGGAGVEFHASLGYSFEITTIKYEDLTKNLDDLSDELGLDVNVLRSMINRGLSEYNKFKESLNGSKKPEPIKQPQEATTSKQKSDKDKTSKEPSKRKTTNKQNGNTQKSKTDSSKKIEKKPLKAA